MANRARKVTRHTASRKAAEATESEDDDDEQLDDEDDDDGTGAGTHQDDSSDDDDDDEDDDDDDSDDDDKSPGKPKLPKTQDELNDLITTRLTRDRASQRKAIIDEVKRELTAEAERKAAEDKNDYETLYKAELAKSGDLQRQLDEVTTTSLKARIVAEEGLPPEVADRLVGSNEEELRADAVKLKKLVGTKKRAPNTDGGSTNKSTTTRRRKRKGDAAEDYNKPEHWLSE